MTTRIKAELSAIIQQMRKIKQHVEQLQKAHEPPARRLALGNLENSVEELLISLRTNAG
jgi:hypothetical protein